jgi:NADH-quinone oxidoreductase subunit G
VCPVGALTAKDFRFRMRAWELYATPSVCPGCATGCNIEIQHAQGEIWRLYPRPNMAVNKYWMCDEGRFTYKEVASQGRVVGALLSGDPAALEAAASFAAARLQAARETGRLGVVFGAGATNEDLFMLKTVVNELGAVQLFIGGKSPVPEREDKILRSADVNPNNAGARLFAKEAGDLTALEKALTDGKIGALWVIGEDLPLSSSSFDAIAKVDIVVQATHHNPLTEIAKAVLPAAAWAEVDGTFTNRQGRAQRIRAALEMRGGSRPHWELILAIARKLGIDFAFDTQGPMTARQLFNRMKAATPDLAAAEWGAPLPLVQLRFQHSRG